MRSRQDTRDGWHRMLLRGGCRRELGGSSCAIQSWGRHTEYLGRNEISSPDVQPALTRCTGVCDVVQPALTRCADVCYDVQPQVCRCV